jgi:hypothetical protein
MPIDASIFVLKVAVLGCEEILVDSELGTIPASVHEGHAVFGAAEVVHVIIDGKKDQMVVPMIPLEPL